MPAYVIFIRKHTRAPSELEIYSQKAPASLAGKPVKIRALYGRHEVIEGEQIEGAAILEFPSIEEAKAWYDGPSYREARQHWHVLHLCSIRELSGAQNQNRRFLYRQNEVQETQCSLFPIYRRLPKLDVAGWLAVAWTAKLSARRGPPRDHPRRIHCHSPQRANG